MLKESESKHDETVAATMKTADPGPAGPLPNLTISKPLAPAAPATPAAPGAMSDLELARLAKADGKDVELNDDNQIVDKRELLSAGLNLSAPNTRRLGAQPAESSKDKAEKVQVHTAVGTAASRREINERRARELQRQMEEEKDRVAAEQEREQRERMERVVAKRNAEGDVLSARERYLARKKRKLEGGEEPMEALGVNEPGA